MKNFKAICSMAYIIFSKNWIIYMFFCFSTYILSRNYKFVLFIILYIYLMPLLHESMHIYFLKRYNVQFKLGCKNLKPSVKPDLVELHNLTSVQRIIIAASGSCTTIFFSLIILLLVKENFLAFVSVLYLLSEIGNLLFFQDGRMIKKEVKGL